MIENIKSSLKYSAVYTVLVISLVLYETFDPGRSRLEVVPLAILFTFAISSVVIIYLLYLVKLHMAMQNLGWKRLLLFAACLIAPVAIYVGYKIQYVNFISQHLITISCALGAAYASVISIFIGGKWIADGFNHKNYDK